MSLGTRLAISWCLLFVGAKSGDGEKEDDKINEEQENNEASDRDNIGNSNQWENETDEQVDDGKISDTREREDGKKQKNKLRKTVTGEHLKLKIENIFNKNTG